MTPEMKTYCEKRFIMLMDAEHPDLPLDFPNVSLVDTVDSYAGIWVVASDDVTPINLGIKSVSRNEGYVQIDIYTPKDHGTGAGDKIAKTAVKIFRRHTGIVGVQGVVTFKDPVILDRGEVRGFQKHQVNTPYRYDFDGSI